MSNYPTFKTFASNSKVTQRAHDTVTKLAALAAQHPGRVVFATRFSTADQVIAHLIFKHRLPIRVFVFDGQVSNALLLRSADYFNANIEVFSQQNHHASAAFLTRNPDVLDIYKK